MPPELPEVDSPSESLETLHLLQEVSRAVNSSLILEDIFEALGDVLSEYIPYDNAVIVILDDSRNGIKILVRMQPDGFLELSGENNLFVGYDPVIDQMIRKPEPLELDAIAIQNLTRSVVLNEDTRHAFVVPLVNKGLVIGLLAVSATHPEKLFSRHFQRLLQVCEQVAIAVENAKLYWQTQAQGGREFLINQLTKAIRESLDIDVMLNTAVDELGKVTGVSRCIIQYSPNPEDISERHEFHYCMPGVLAILRLESEPLLETQVFQIRQQLKPLETGWQSYPLNPFILNDVRDCPEFFASPEFFTRNRINSLAVFPILIGDYLAGTITLHQCEVVRTWLIEDIELFQAIAEHLGVAISQAQLFKTLETQKQQLEKTLTELQQAQVHLIQSEKMAVLGQFVAGIAHEVNTPLGTMASNNDTIGRCVQKLDALLKNAAQSNELAGFENLLSSVQELLSINKMAAERIQEIVKNLRNFSRIDESELKSVDLHENIDSTLLLMKSAMPKNLRLEKKYDPTMPLVTCYPGLLNQVFMNLMVNAIHAMSGNDGSEQGNKAAGAPLCLTIETCFNKEEGWVQVRIQDNGKGIPPENLHKIFDPGFTTKGVGVGTGLGLALCYKIVEKHQGRIDVTSQLGQGSIFTVSIPLKQRLP